MATVIQETLYVKTTQSCYKTTLTGLGCYGVDTWVNAGPTYNYEMLIVFHYNNTSVRYVHRTTSECKELIKLANQHLALIMSCT